jgi:hypothetical protein
LSRNSRKILTDRPQVKYYEFEILSQGVGSSNSLLSGNLGQGKTMIIVRDISNIIMNHQMMIDTMYQEAIAKNYSHEEMTPLNFIINGSDLAKRQILDMIVQVQNDKKME